MKPAHKGQSCFHHFSESWAPRRTSHPSRSLGLHWRAGHRALPTRCPSRRPAPGPRACHEGCVQSWHLRSARITPRGGCVVDAMVLTVRPENHLFHCCEWPVARGKGRLHPRLSEQLSGPVSHTSSCVMTPSNNRAEKLLRLRKARKHSAGRMETLEAQQELGALPAGG